MECTGGEDGGGEAGCGCQQLYSLHNLDWAEADFLEGKPQSYVSNDCANGSDSKFKFSRNYLPSSLSAQMR